MEKGTVPAKKRNRQNWRYFTRLQAANTWLVRFSSLTPWLLLANRHRRNQQHKSTDLGHIYHQKRPVYFNTLCGRRDHFYWFREEFSTPTEWLLNPEIKLKFKRYFGLFYFFVPSGIPLQSSTDTEEANKLIGVEKKTNGVRYRNRKLNTINQTSQTK